MTFKKDKTQYNSHLSHRVCHVYAKKMRVCATQSVRTTRCSVSTEHDLCERSHPLVRVPAPALFRPADEEGLCCGVVAPLKDLPNPWCRD